MPKHPNKKLKNGTGTLSKEIKTNCKCWHRTPGQKITTAAL